MARRFLPMIITTSRVRLLGGFLRGVDKNKFSKFGGYFLQLSMKSVDHGYASVGVDRRADGVGQEVAAFPAYTDLEGQMHAVDEAVGVVGLRVGNELGGA